MAYLIDGHNLIPKIPGMSLENLDDEQQLLDLIQRFCHARRQKAEVFFDRAPFGKAKERQFGLVKAHFVSRQSSADEAIRKRLVQFGRGAANWKVVTSDRQVQVEAHTRGAEVISSEEFAALLVETLAKGSPGESGAKDFSSGDLDEWLRLFGQDKRE